MSVCWVLVLVVGVVGAVYSFVWRKRGTVKNGPLKGDFEEGFNVCIVGGGPAGATAACYLARVGVKRILLLDKKAFPRTKPCGDAWCEIAIAILEELGILSKMEAAGICHPVQRGGFVSPSGLECVGGPYGSASRIRTYAIKRFRADEFIVREAQALGVEVREECEVIGENFQGNYWTITTKGGGDPIRARMLLAADGVQSLIAKRLGLVSGIGSASCTHQYIENAAPDADGVMIFNKSMLPGYSGNGALFLLLFFGSALTISLHSHFQAC